MATTRVIVVRHGARFDYANPDWAERAEKLGLNPRDPPLSALGFRQADQAAVQIEKRLRETGDTVDAILVSPYLRAIQTAQPLARATGLPLCVEEGLSETHHCPDILPLARDRFAYFPEVDEAYETLHPIKADATEFGLPCELYPESYMRRMYDVGHEIASAFEGKTVVCYTHAASVCLVAGLLGIPFPDDLSFTFAPCGIFELELGPKTDHAWVMVSDGHSNTSFITENDDTTHPWGFNNPYRLVWNDLIADKTAGKGAAEKSKEAETLKKSTL